MKVSLISASIFTIGIAASTKEGYNALLNRVLHDYEAKNYHDNEIESLKEKIKYAKDIGDARIYEASIRQLEANPPFTHDGDYTKKFGHYECPYCVKQWTSANAWQNYGQDCKKCSRSTLAYRLNRLKSAGGEVKNKRPHQCQMCSKCTEIGESCVKLIKK